MTVHEEACRPGLDRTPGHTPSMRRAWSRARCVLVLAVLLGAGGAAATGRADETIRVHYLPNDKPLSYRDEAGRARGQYIRIMDLLGRSAAVAFVYESYPWPRAEGMIRQGTLDAFVAVPSEERQSFVLFAPTPMVETRHLIYHRASDPRLDHVETRADLHGLLQLTTVGNQTIETYDPATVRAVRTFDLMLKMVDAGRADYFIGDPLLVPPIAARLGLASRIRGSRAPFLGAFSFCFGLRKDYPGAAGIIARLDTAIRSARQSGEIDRILAMPQ
jgi:polar amino acid transport system substrate-binding protein